MARSMKQAAIPRQAERRAGRQEVVDIATTALSGLAMVAALAMVFLYAPREAVMGEVQRIFYFHVASAWVGFVAFGVTCAGSIAYLAGRRRIWDVLALSSGQVGLAFMTMAVLTGALWARPVWGVYWTWEPRLTISAIQLLLYLAYVSLRNVVDDRDRAARFAAVYGIIAFVTVPLSWFAIRWWRTIHPDLFSGGGGMAVTPPMWHTLLVSIVAFSLLYVTLLRMRMRLQQDAERLEDLRAELDAEV